MHASEVLELALHGLALAYLVSTSEFQRNARLREATTLLDSHESARRLAQPEKMRRWLAAVRRVEGSLSQIGMRSLATHAASPARH